MKNILALCLLFYFFGTSLLADDDLNDDSMASEINKSSENNISSVNQLEIILRGDADGITLKALLEAAENNYSIQAQNLLTRQAQKDHLVSQLTFIPTLDMQYNFNHSSASVPISYQTQNAQINFNFRFDWANVESVREKGATVVKTQYDSKHTKQSVYLQIIQEYYTYFNNESSLITLQQKLQQIRSDVARVQSLYDQGLRTIADLESLKSQASLTEYQIHDANLALERSKLTLEYLTNTKLQSIKRTKIDDPALKLENRNDIRSLEYQILAQKYQNKQLHYYPIFNLQDTYTYNIQIPDFAQALINSGTLPPSFLASYANHQNTLGISVSYALFAKIGQSVQRQSFTLARMANERNLSYLKQEQKKDEEVYRKAIDVAKNQIRSAKASLISANISYDNMKKRYESNLVTFTEYLQALSTKYDAESTFIQALNNFEIQKANYIFYSGQELENYVE